MSVASAVLVREPRAAPSRDGKGAEIRAKIAANRAKRLGIAAAMKREAGVTEHTVHKEDYGGLAYIGTGRIVSPEGRKIVQLYTLAHACGHIFLHNSGDGYWLAGHIKEFEAEGHAHKAFREHGMTLSRRLSKSGREYVASWSARDRAAGIPIDPRVRTYAAGRWSPYAPLRMVPSTWRMFRAGGALAAPANVARSAWRRSLLDGLRAAARRALGRSGQAAPKGLAGEAAAVLRLAAGWALHGTVLCHLGLQIAQAYHPILDVFPKQPGDVPGPSCGRHSPAASCSPTSPCFGAR